MKIPLPKMLRHWRENEFERHLQPAPQRTGIRVWAFAAARPRLYRLAARFAAAVLGLAAGRRGRIRSLPFAAGWTGCRDLPAPEGGTFLDQWRKGVRR